MGGRFSKKLYNLIPGQDDRFQSTGPGGKGRVRENRRGFPARFQAVRRSGPFCLGKRGGHQKRETGIACLPLLSSGFDLDISFPTPNHNPAKRTLLRRGWSGIIGLEQKEKPEHPIRILRRGPSVIIGSGKIQSYQWFWRSK